MPDDPTAADATEHDMADHLTAIAQQSQRIAARFLSGQGAAGAGTASDPLNLSAALGAMARSLAEDPSPLIDAQMKWWDGYLRLWQQGAQRLQGEEPAEPVAAPAPDDRRFRDPAWTESWVFDHLKQSYLLTAACMQSAVGNLRGLDEKDAAKLAFYTRQFVDALAPTNFLATNPAALKETAETRGENLLRGLRNVLDDLERNEGRFAPRMSDEDHFTLGETIATTPGKVVFQNELMQLIQYAPSTETVFRRPLLIVPPWINKYYVLDLRPKNSFVRWAVSKGYSVFMISWVNPDERLAEKTFEDYMVEGPLAALDAIEQATGECDVAAIGYCLGGTLTAATLAYLAARGDKRIRSATFFASLVDFTEPGELGVFIDDAQLESLEAMMAEKGYLEGRHMATTFNMLRANDLIWSFVVNNYLLGREPLPFDLLFWNADSTRMPAAMHGFYLRKMYQENLLAQPEGLSLAGVPIDLRPHRYPHLYRRDSGGPHRAVAVLFRRLRTLSGAAPLRPRRLRPYRRHHQSAGGRQVRLLDRAGRGGAGRRCMARRSRTPRGLLVERLARLAAPPLRRQEGAGARPRRRRAQADRGRAGRLRPGVVAADARCGGPEDARYSPARFA